MATFIPTFRDFVDPELLNLTPDVIVQNENSSNTAEFLPLVYGLRRITPPRIWAGYSDVDPNSLVCVYGLSHGECLGIYRLFVNDVYVQTDQPMLVDEANLMSALNNTSTSMTIVNPVGSSIYADIAEFEFMSGNEQYLNTQGIYDRYTSRLLEKHVKDPNRRPSYDPDICYFVAVFTDDGTDENPYRGVPKVTVDLFGRRVSAGPSDDPSVREYTTNPIKCFYDYLTNETYGCNIPKESVDGFGVGSSWRSVRDYADEDYTNTTNTGESIITTKYTMNKNIDLSNDRLTNVSEILKTYMLMMPYIDGKYKLIAEQQGTAEIDLTENSLVGSVKITYPDRNTRYSSINYTYVDPEIGFNTVRKTYPSDATELAQYITEDNGKTSSANLDMPGITDPFQAERIAKTYLNKVRYQPKFEFTVFKDFFQYQVGDIIRLKITVPDIDLTNVRVTTMTLNPNNTITVVAYEHSNGFYEPFPNFVTNKPEYLQPLVPTQGGVIVRRPSENPISIYPPGGGDGNPGEGDDGDPGTPEPTPIVPDPSPTPVEEPPYLYTDNLSTLSTFGAGDTPNRFYPNHLTLVNPASDGSKENSTYKESIIPSARIMFFHSFPYGYYRMELSITDRLAAIPDGTLSSGATLRAVYELPDGSYGTLIKPSNYLNPIYYRWDPEINSDNVDVDDPIYGASQMRYSTWQRGGNALFFTSDYNPNADVPADRKGMFRTSSSTAAINFYPVGGALTQTTSNIIDRFIRHDIRPIVAAQNNGATNFITNSSDITMTFKFFDRYTREYFGTYSFSFGPSSMSTYSNDIVFSRTAYNNTTTFRDSGGTYPDIPF